MKSDMVVYSFTYSFIWRFSSSFYVVINAELWRLSGPGVERSTVGVREEACSGVGEIGCGSGCGVLCC